MLFTVLGFDRRCTILLLRVRPSKAFAIGQREKREKICLADSDVVEVCEVRKNEGIAPSDIRVI